LCLVAMVCLVVSVSLATGTDSRAGNIHVEDDFGGTISLDSPAMRIIALYGAYNEVLAAMGLENRLVGRTKADRLPPSILSKPSIGTHMRPNVEMVLALKPDLIVQGAGRRQAMMPVIQLRNQGLRVAVFNPTTFDGLFSTIRRIGVLTGESARADRLIGSLQGRLAAVKRRLRGDPRRPRVFFEVRYPNLLAAGKRSIVNDVISRAGGVNCVTVDKKLVRMNMEALVSASPDYYIVQKGPMNRNPVPPRKRPHFTILEAVRTGRVANVDEQVFSRPGPRSVDAVEQLAAVLHPDAGERKSK
jgi:iron complex transport system substrate-binding protein